MTQKGISKMNVREVMVDRLTSCKPNTNLATVAGLMWENDCGVLPVLDDSGKVVGMITDRDTCIAVATRHQLASDILVSEVMSSPVYACHPDDDIQHALNTMQEGNVLRLPVINDDGDLEGILSVYGIVLHAGNDNGKKNQVLSAERVVSTLKGISEHRFSKSSGERQNPPRSAHA